MRKKSTREVGSFALKLDMSKAYNRVEWEFVILMLQKIGLKDSWIQKIRMCIETVSYFVTLNGDVGETFLPTRGLRQGDPLNPYQFLVCDEDYPLFFDRRLLTKVLRGYRINKYAPLATHFFLVDDSLIFGESTVKGANALKECLESYVKCSGQVVNYEKSRLFFSANV